MDFPDGFVWGTATAAHQVEGGNWNNDWWAWEHTAGSGCVEPSGDACDQWHRYETDLALMAELGFNAYRFSVEWSRIEPDPGMWSQASVDHYRAVCERCLELGLAPMVTFHHFTTPRWVAARGGWADPETADRFASFCERTVRALGDVISWAATFNEPNVVALMGYQSGIFPPGRRDSRMRREVTDIQLDAHRKAAAALRAGPGTFPVGLTLSMTDFVAVDGGEERVARYRRSGEDMWLEAARQDDWFGVQTYTRMLVGPNGPLGNAEGVPTTQMGYERWPAALEGCIRRADEVIGGATPLMVSENGISTDDDAERTEFVRDALAGVYACIADGIHVRGYVYWSLLDNFEWAFGYGPKFGLVGVDRATFARMPKPSASWLGAVARANAVG
ncbi:MAG: glycoside hydrolase family 1 protein [Acidimicrobiales bacterium]